MAIPLFITYLADALLNAFLIFLVWHYAGVKCLEQYAIVFPIQQIFGVGIPRSIAQGAVSVIQKLTLSNERKSAEMVFTIQTLLQLGYAFCSLIFSYIFSLSFSNLSKGESISNYTTFYVPVMVSGQAFANIFNAQLEPFLILEAKHLYNFRRSLLASVMKLMLICLCY